LWTTVCKREEKLITFGESQLSRLEDKVNEQFKSSLELHVHEFFEPVAITAGEAGVRIIVDACMQRAVERGFVGRASIQSYLDLALLLGLDFQADPALKEIAAHLDFEKTQEANTPKDLEALKHLDETAFEPDPIEMLDKAYDAAWDWLDRTVGEDFQNLYKALARLRSILSDLESAGEEPLALAKKIFPEKAEALQSDALDAAFQDYASRAVADEIRPKGVLAYQLMCFVGGAGVFADPAFSVSGTHFAAGLTKNSSGLGAEELSKAASTYIDALLVSARSAAQGQANG
jgi:hypothetical protein